ncbi:MAG: hypothetical protein PHE43_03705 [Candidatus Nanoarchaeia archaeon]|nr:hypothetical protein [Candidatus Nanoarchaeia archaeon]
MKDSKRIEYLAEFVFDKSIHQEIAERKVKSLAAVYLWQTTRQIAGKYNLDIQEVQDLITFKKCNKPIQITKRTEFASDYIDGIFQVYDSKFQNELTKKIIKPKDIDGLIDIINLDLIEHAIEDLSQKWTK